MQSSRLQDAIINSKEERAVPAAQLAKLKTDSEYLLTDISANRLRSGLTDLSELLVQAAEAESSNSRFGDYLRNVAGRNSADLLHAWSVLSRHKQREKFIKYNNELLKKYLLAEHAQRLSVDFQAIRNSPLR